MASRPRTASAQKRLVKELLSNIIELENPNVSVAKSVTFVKQLTTVAVCSIAYRRELLPHSAFASKRMAGEEVHVIQGSDEIPSSRIFINWLKAAFKLVHSHQLQKLMLIIEKESVILEVYTISFSYNDETVLCNLSGEVDGEVVLERSQVLPEDIGKSVRQVIRCIRAHSTTLRPLPPGSALSMRIIMDEDIPVEHYKNCSEELKLPPQAETLKLGKVETKFSTFALSSKSVFYEEDEMSAMRIQQECSQQMGNEEDIIDLDEIPSSQSEIFGLGSLNSSLSQSNLTGNKEDEYDSNKTNLSEKLSVVSLKEKVFACICECSELIDETIVCASCHTYQHKACYKMLENHQVETHVCVKCHNPDEGKLCSVPEILNEDNQKESALFRQAFMYCCNSSQVSCQLLMTHLKVPRQLADVIFKRLDAEGCLEPATNRGPVRKVKPDLKVNLQGHFFSETPDVNMQMDIPDSPVILSSEGSEYSKRQRIEEEEVSPSVVASPQVKQRKILVSATKLKKYSANTIDEEEEGSPSIVASPQAKQRKILVSATKLKKYSANTIDEEEDVPTFVADSPQVKQRKILVSAIKLKKYNT